MLSGRVIKGCFEEIEVRGKKLVIMCYEVQKPSHLHFVLVLAHKIPKATSNSRSTNLSCVFAFEP